MPDHCTAYALSDPKEKSLCVECQHDHASSCPQCEELKSALKEVEAALSKNSTIPEDVRDDLLYTYQSAVQAIQAWKAHMLRSLQQDKARTTVLDQGPRYDQGTYNPRLGYEVAATEVPRNPSRVVWETR